MNLSVLFPIVGCILNFFLAVFVLWYGYRQPANRIYFLWGLSVTIWHIGGFFCFTATNPTDGLLAVRLCWVGVLFVPVLLLHLSLAVAQMPVIWYVWVLYMLTGALLVSNLTPFLIRDVRHLGVTGYYAVPGPGFYIFMAFFGIVFFSIYVLIQRRRTFPALQRTRLDALIFGQSVLVVFGTNDLLPIMGITTYPFTNIAVYPYGYAAATLYGLIFGYSVLQRQLLDIQIHLSRFAAQAVRLVLAFLIGLSLMLTATLIAPKAFNVVSFTSGVLVLLLSLTIATMLFPRLLGSSGGDKWERRILGDRFEYQDQVRNFIENMTWYGNFDHFLDDLHDLFIRTFALRSHSIILRDDTTRAYQTMRAYPEGATELLAELQPSSPVIQCFEDGACEYLSLARDAVYLRSTSIEQQAREELAPLGGELCFPLMVQSQPFGLLVVGEKTNSEPFTVTDINLLLALAKTMGLIVSQIRLKDQILHAQELDLLGRLSRGMAHDLNNLLTPVSTLLQLACESGVCDEELLPTAALNVQTMRSYIREALFFSEQARPEFKTGRLDLVVLETVELAAGSRKKDVQIVADADEEIEIEMNVVLIQRLLTNLISNGIDASPQNSTIRVRVDRLPRTDADRDWVRLSVIDAGEGISRENLERVQAPYFTTKDRGDETRGFGLGLAICRKIVGLHGGKLAIESKLRKGTTVQVDLPSHQPVADVTHQSLLPLPTPA